MAVTQIVLDRQATARIFSFGSTGSGTDALVTINKGTAATSTVVLDVKASCNIGGDLNLTGNLNITGNINEQTVTNLLVTDITITVNKGGTTAGGAGAGILVEGDSAAVVAKLIFDNSLTSKWKAGDGSAQAEVVTVSAAQTLTSKTLTTPTIGDHTNAQHNHTNAAGGGQITDAALSAAVTVPKGGTGNTTFTAYSVICAGTTATGIFQNVSGLGSSGNVLTSNGAAALPTWQPVTTSNYFRSTVVSGTQDSANKVFTIANTVSSGSEQIYINGQLLMPGSSNDYVYNGTTTVTFQAGFTAPAATDVLRVYGNY